MGDSYAPGCIYTTQVYIEVHSYKVYKLREIVMKEGTDTEGQCTSRRYQTPQSVAAVERVVMAQVVQTGAVDRNHDLQVHCIASRTF